MKRVFTAILLFALVTWAKAGETIIFNGGISRQNAGGTINLLSGYSLNIGGGMEIYDDLFGVVKFSLPGQYTSSTYPVILDINGINDTLNFNEFSLYDFQLQGHYLFRLSDNAKLFPKVFGGLGLHWLYNSKHKTGEADVKFNGIGPEFGFGGIYQSSKNLYFDFTVSVKFPYYNEYKRQYSDKVAIGNDEQVLCFNVSLFYLINIGSQSHDFEW